MSEQAQVAVDADGAGEGNVVASESKAPGEYRFTVLRVLATAVRVTKRNFMPFFVLACVFEVPVLLLQFRGAVEDLALAFPMMLVTNAIMSAVVAYGVIMDLHGTRPSTRTCIATGFAQVGRVVGVALVSTLAIMGATLLFVIPGLIVALMLYVTVPVTIIEGIGIRAAMRRSRELTNGHKGELFLIMAVAMGISTAIQQFGRHQLGPDAAFVWSALGGAFSSMFFAVTAAVAYVELRTLRDGTRIPEIATAFARIRK